MLISKFVFAGNRDALVQQQQAVLLHNTVIRFLKQFLGFAFAAAIGHFYYPNLETVIG